eukprot:TRINITY_DN53711_c0_g1_i1.p1 TRINITY_DN53711_c0_g1~~TRINITY_DN53711_c0_g1_i1.p1  ORF type:complete len:408 (+),score=93.90 TRINITY_DN53711_c0_g1_i1:27-1226(+)
MLSAAFIGWQDGGAPLRGSCAAPPKLGRGFAKRVVVLSRGRLEARWLWRSMTLSASACFAARKAKRLRRGSHIAVRCAQACATASDLEMREDDQKLQASLDVLRDQDFFSLFRFDLFTPCKALCLEEQGCTSECEVEPTSGAPQFIEEEDLQFVYEIDGWYRIDPPVEAAEYYDLRSYSEGYTGYDGSVVWSFIHKNIEYQEPVEHCVGEQFNTSLEALHAHISAHIVADMKAREEAGESFGESSAAAFSRKLGRSPKRLEALRSSQRLLLGAVHKASETLLSREYGDEAEAILRELTTVCECAAGVEPLDLTAPSEVLSSCRLRLRELCLAMDCVECNKCRIHGKVAALGLASAFKVLCSGSSASPALNRSEAAALLATLAKVTDALRLCQQLSKDLD